MRPDIRPHLFFYYSLLSAWTGIIQYVQLNTSNIFLIGPMGAGKTTVGKRLAHRLSRQFYDSDAEIEASTGASIPLIFELEGEKGFRKRECRMIATLVKKKPIVLATGGGVVLDKKNRQQLTENGYVVYLKSVPEKLMLRTIKDKTRPFLQSADPQATIKKILKQREPLYREIADLIVETDQLGITRVVDTLYRHCIDK